jgi:hypothetical protein
MIARELGGNRFALSLFWMGCTYLVIRSIRNRESSETYTRYTAAMSLDKMSY